MRRKPRTIADELRAAIAQAQRDKTQYRIAQAAGMKMAQLGRIASGETVPRIDTADRVLAAIGYRLAIVRADAK